MYLLFLPLENQERIYRLVFRGWRGLVILGVLFVSSISLLVFSKDIVFSYIALLQLVLFPPPVSQFTGSIDVLRRSGFCGQNMPGSWPQSHLQSHQ